MPPTAFGNLPPPAVPVVILGPLAFPLGIFAPCAFWLFGPALFGSFLSCWALWALFGALWPSLCVFVPCGFVCPALLGFFLSRLGLFGSPWGPLVLPWASLPLCAFLLCLPCSFWVLFCWVGAFLALPGACWPYSGRLCALCLLALFALPSWFLLVFFVLPLGLLFGPLWPPVLWSLVGRLASRFFGLCALLVCGRLAACFFVLVI